MFEFRLLYITIKIRAEQSVSAPPLISSAVFVPHFPCPASAEQLLRLLSAIRTPGSCSPSNSYQPVPGESCSQVPLDLLTSGELKLLPYAEGALPGRPVKGLSCVCSTWSISNGIWDQFHGEGEHKNTLDMEEEHVFPYAALYPGLEQLPLRAMAIHQ